MKAIELSVSTAAKTDFKNITKDVQKAVKDSEIRNGLCTVYIPHTTAGVTINEAADPDVVSDIQMELSKIVPFNDNYAHMEGNSAAHIKTSMVGPSIGIPIIDGSLSLGTWQGIFFCEFDGPRRRKAIVQCIPSE